MTEKRAAGICGFPDMRSGGGALSATLIARAPGRGPTSRLLPHPEIAYAQAMGQLALYRLLEEQGDVRIGAQAGLRRGRRNPSGHAAAGVLDRHGGRRPDRQPDQVAEWWDAGLRSWPATTASAPLLRHRHARWASARRHPLLEEMKRRHGLD